MLLFGIALFAAILFGAAEARKRTSDSVLDWLPETFEETQIFRKQYLKTFPEGELLMVRWEGCQLEDPSQEIIGCALTEPTVAAGEPYFGRFFSTERVLDELMSAPMNLSRSQAITRMKGWIASADGEQGCIVLFLSSHGHRDRHAAIARVYEAIAQELSLPREKIYVAGPTVDSVAIAQAGRSAQKTLLPFFILFCYGLLWFLLRSYRASLFVFLIAILNEELSIAVIYYLGKIAVLVNALAVSRGFSGGIMREFHADTISMLVGSLCYVLTISGGIHIVNYYKEEIAESGLAGAPLRALKRAFLPCFLATLTTIMGIGSLVISEVIPIQNFGLFASITLALGTAFMFLFIPTLLELFPIKRWESETQAQKLLEADENRHRSKLSLDWLAVWLKLSRHLEKRRILITTASITVMVLASVGIYWLKTTVTLRGMFSPQAKVIQDYNFLERQIGGLIPIEIMLTVKKQPAPGENTVAEKDMTLLQQLYVVKKVSDSLRNVESVDVVLSSLVFLPDLPSQRPTFAETAKRAAFNSILQSKRNRLEETLFFKEEDHAFHWRINLRIPAYLDKEYAPLLRHLKTTTTETLSRLKQSGEIKNEVSMLITGAIPLVHRAQAQLLSDLIESYIVAFILIWLTMIVLLRGFWPGTLSMVPNIFPTAIVFGVMGWMKFPVDMGSMMTASVALGIAVDGTLHYLTWFYRGLENGMSRYESIRFGYVHCANALTQAAIVCGLGMLVFVLSDFVPMARFSWLLFILLFIALIGDLIIFPAMLYSPLGKMFERKKYPHAKATGVHEPPVATGVQEPPVATGVHEPSVATGVQEPPVATGVQFTTRYHWGDS